MNYRIHIRTNRIQIGRHQIFFEKRKVGISYSVLDVFLFTLARIIIQKAIEPTHLIAAQQKSIYNL